MTEKIIPIKPTVYQQLKQGIEYAKTSLQPRELLYQMYGRMEMAYHLGAISIDEFMKLNTECVKNGINNPKYFKHHHLRSDKK